MDWSTLEDEPIQADRLDKGMGRFGIPVDFLCRWTSQPSTSRAVFWRPLDRMPRVEQLARRGAWPNYERSLPFRRPQNPHPLRESSRMPQRVSLPSSPVGKGPRSEIHA